MITTPSAKVLKSQMSQFMFEINELLSIAPSPAINFSVRQCQSMLKDMQYIYLRLGRKMKNCF